MARWRRRPKRAASSDDENVGITFLSSDEEEANKDLTLEIAEQARQRQAKKRKRPDAASEEVEAETEGAKKKTRKPIKKRKKSDESGAASNSLLSSVERQDLGFFQDLVDAPEEDLSLSGKGDSGDRGVKEALDNVVMRKLLRGPRYFDPGEGILQTCYKCGEEDHVAVDCVMEKRQKPCFVCGMFGHNARRCEQGRDCFICKGRGHFAKDCPDKHKIADYDSLCLRCGVIGHDMSSCRDKYTPDDLKKIQCYVCNKYGHLCCADLNFLGLEKVSCYNCAQVGHSGVGCAKQHGETDFVAPAILCYKCGEEGHFARGCTKISKPSRLKANSSTLRTYLKETRASSRSKSVSRDFGKTHKSKSKPGEERKNVTSSKCRRRVGWSFDDLHAEIKTRSKANGWASSRTPKRKVQSGSPCKKLRSFFGNPSRHDSKGTYQHHQHGY